MENENEEGTGAACFGEGKAIRHPEEKVKRHHLNVVIESITILM